MDTWLTLMTRAIRLDLTRSTLNSGPRVTGAHLSFVRKLRISTRGLLQAVAGCWLASWLAAN